MNKILRYIFLLFRVSKDFLNVSPTFKHDEQENWLILRWSSFFGSFILLRLQRLLQRLPNRRIRWIEKSIACYQSESMLLYLHHLSTPQKGSGSIMALPETSRAFLCSDVPHGLVSKLRLCCLDYSALLGLPCSFSIVVIWFLLREWPL